LRFETWTFREVPVLETTLMLTPLSGTLTPLVGWSAVQYDLLSLITQCHRSSPERVLREVTAKIRSAEAKTEKNL
jgi:hypothetical protein